jgi:predicted ATPase
LQNEQAMLLDPCLDDPSMHLVFDDTGQVGSSTERGQCTIETLALNRESLVRARRAVIDEAKNVMGYATVNDFAGIEFLTQHLTRTSPYVAAKIQTLAVWVKESPFGASSNLAPQILAASLPEHERSGAASLTRGDVAQAQSALQSRLEGQERQSVEGGTGTEQTGYFGGVRRIERVVIENFKGIERLELTVPPPSAERESWLMLVGENATGKSSVLQAIALALLGQEHANRLGLDPNRFVRRSTPAQPVFVQVNLTNLSQPVELRYYDNSSGFTVTPPSELVLLLGYGATRVLPRASSGDGVTPQRYIRVKNLFDPHAELQNAERWLCNRQEVDDERFEQVAYALKQLLLLAGEDRIFRKADEVCVETAGQEMRLDQLSDGYQSVVALAVDIMMGLFLWSSMEDAEGIVLIDEIEAHLHPRWKMEIVPRLRAVFPRLMFIASTHDPLCLRGLAPGEIVVLRRNEGPIEVQVITESIDHLRADQLLTSPLFGLVTTRDRRINLDIARYSELLGQTERTPEEEELFQLLSSQLDTQLQPGESAGANIARQTYRKALEQVVLPDLKQKLAAFEKDHTVTVAAREEMARLLGLTSR